MPSSTRSGSVPLVQVPGDLRGDAAARRGSRCPTAGVWMRSRSTPSSSSHARRREALGLVVRATPCRPGRCRRRPRASRWGRGPRGCAARRPRRPTRPAPWRRPSRSCSVVSARVVVARRGHQLDAVGDRAGERRHAVLLDRRAVERGVTGVEHQVAPSTQDERADQGGHADVAVQVGDERRRSPGRRRRWWPSGTPRRRWAPGPATRPGTSAARPTRPSATRSPRCRTSRSSSARRPPGRRTCR